jgi:hypothetical protein
MAAVALAIQNTPTAKNRTLSMVGRVLKEEM